MRIGGLIKSSLVDYPGKVAAVIFTQGCNFRCPFCHNAGLVLPSLYKEPLKEEEVITFLSGRVSQLQGVVITGGEPTIQPDLPDFLRRIKSLGYAVKLDTNGSRPEVLADIIAAGLVDYVAMDIKTSMASYDRACGVAVNTENILRSLEILRRSSVQCLFRTTVVRSFVSAGDIEEIKDLVRDAPYILQEFVHRDNILDPSLLDQRPYSAEELAALKARWEKPCPGQTA